MPLLGSVLPILYCTLACMFLQREGDTRTRVLKVSPRHVYLSSSKLPQNRAQAQDKTGSTLTLRFDIWIGRGLLQGLYPTQIVVAGGGRRRPRGAASRSLRASCLSSVSPAAAPSYWWSWCEVSRPRHHRSGSCLLFTVRISDRWRYGGHHTFAEELRSEIIFLISCKTAKRVQAQFPR